MSHRLVHSFPSSYQSSAAYLSAQNIFRLHEFCGEMAMFSGKNLSNSPIDVREDVYS